MSEHKEGDLMVFYVPQLPMNAFEYPVPDLKTAAIVLDALERLSLFEFENRVKPDYADMSGVSRYETDGDGGFDWFCVDEEELAEVLA
jgi:hypothetical protein